MKKCWIILLGMLFAAGGHAREIAKDYVSLAGIAKLEPFPDRSEIQRRIGAAGSATVLEGLPHNFWESKAFRREAARTDVTWIHDLGFYQQPLTVSADDLAAVRTIASDADAFTLHSMPHDCGDFHPDYCVIWRKGDIFVQAMICLGCGELIFLTNEGYSYVDMRKETHTSLKKLLGKYRLNRPPEAFGGDEDALPPPVLIKPPESKPSS